MKVEVLSPENSFSLDNITLVSFTTDSGEIGIMPGHESMACLIIPGILKIKQNNQTFEYFVTSGFANISEQSAVLIIEEFFETSQINPELLKIKELEFNQLSAKHPEYEEKELVIQSLKSLI